MSPKERLLMQGSNLLQTQCLEDADGSGSTCRYLQLISALITQMRLILFRSQCPITSQ